MKAINSMKEIQSISLEILSFIKTVCEENDIKFFLAYGTCLGAIRHNGFIPWDDDVDIFMLREEYERFREVMKCRNNERYKLLDLQLCPNYSLPLPKVVDTNTYLRMTTQLESEKLGVFVDVFVMDNIPNDPEKMKKHLRKMEYVQKKWTIAQYIPEEDNHRKKLRSIIKEYFFSLIRKKGPRYYACKLEKMATKYMNVACTKAGSMTFSSNRFNECFEKTIFGNGKMHIFEDAMYFVPENADEYLTYKYGDYMKLPPVEKRCAHHSFVAYHKV